MCAMTQDNFLVREEPIERLERIVYALSEACREFGSAQDKTRAALSKALSAECTVCGTRITGDELLALSQLPSALETSGRIKWLRLGSCPRNGCDSRAYLLMFQNHPGLDWRELFSKTENASQESADASEPEPETAPATLEV